VFTPFMVTARKFPVNQDVVAIIGDSIPHGQADDNGPENPAGYAERGCVLAGFPIVQMSAGGMGMTGWVTRPYWFWRMAGVERGDDRDDRAGHEPQQRDRR
jgi:hypothetical protein